MVCSLPAPLLTRVVCSTQSRRTTSSKSYADVTARTGSDAAFLVCSAQGHGNTGGGSFTEIIGAPPTAGKWIITAGVTYVSGVSFNSSSLCVGELTSVLGCSIGGRAALDFVLHCQRYCHVERAQSAFFIIPWFLFGLLPPGEFPTLPLRTVAYSRTSRAILVSNRSPEAYRLTESRPLPRVIVPSHTEPHINS